MKSRSENTRFGPCLHKMTVLRWSQGRERAQKRTLKRRMSLKKEWETEHETEWETEQLEPNETEWE